MAAERVVKADTLTVYDFDEETVFILRRMSDDYGHPVGTGQQ